MLELGGHTIDLGVIVGLVGGVVFFSSWMLQAWETRREGRAVVSWRFFALRVVGSCLLLVEAVRVQSPGLILVNFATLLLMSYNLWVIARAAPSRPRPDG